jgi:hypothetical protein
MSTHKSFGVPRIEFTPELMHTIENTRINPFGDLPEPLPIMQANAALNALDKFQPTSVDQREAEQPFAQLKGQFLIDREGIIRWANVECQEGLSGVGRFPTSEELVSAAQIAAAV